MHEYVIIYTQAVLKLNVNIARKALCEKWPTTKLLDHV